MRIVVLGGTDQDGRKVVENLERRAQAVVVASPASGVDARTERGRDAALDYADAVIDATNAPDLSGRAAREFKKSTRRLLDAEERAGVKHHVLLSIVGAGIAEWNTTQGTVHLPAKPVQPGLPLSPMRLAPTTSDAWVHEQGQQELCGVR